MEKIGETEFNLESQVYSLKTAMEIKLSQRIELLSRSPDPRVLEWIVFILKEGGVIAYPTDSGFALGCMMGKMPALERIKAIRGLADDHPFTLMCRDLSEVSEFAKVDTAAFRVLKRHTPGGYTFILEATLDASKKLKMKKKTVGIRIPDHEIPIKITEALGEPILSTTLWLPDDESPLKDPDDVSDRLGDQIDLIIFGGYCGFEQTSVVDLTGNYPIVLRQGSGDISEFQIE
jgi:tRNA threonylcarbamoyl adenosine modification protein (Sua5/YciO/YrdC/YwlC family)